MKSHPEAAERGELTDSAERILVSPETQHGEEHANAISAMHRKMVIPGDVVNRATQELPDDQRSAIRGMHAYAVENNLSNAEVGKLLKVTDAVISLVFRGKYGASVANIASEMKRFLALMEKRNQGRKLAFIKTKLWEKMETVCDTAREFQKIAFFFGDSQVGKSECLKYYRETHNHGSTIYVEVPTGGGLIHFLTKLAEALRIQTQMREMDLRRRIFSAFDDRMLLIVDEAHRAIPGRYVQRTALKTIEFVRELFNERQCGVVFCATNVFRDEMEQGEVSLIMKQTRRRRLCAMQLPDKPSREDLNIFAKAYGLPPSAGAARTLEAKVIEEEALGMWLTLLRMAAVLAAKREMKWDHVHAAYQGLREMETPPVSN